MNSKECFAAAYDRSPQKNKFCNDLSLLPGVMCYNSDLNFCKGYIKALLDSNFVFTGPHEVYILSYESSASNNDRHYVLQDHTSFIEACIAMKDKIFTSIPTPHKVLVKMVSLRFQKISSDIQPGDILNTREACQAWFEPIPQWKHCRKILEKITKRDDITDDVYQEAWSMFEVGRVMES